jgi:hypothetical protein
MGRLDGTGFPRDKAIMLGDKIKRTPAIYKATWRNIPEDINLQQYRCENFRSRKSTAGICRCGFCRNYYLVSVLGTSAKLRKANNSFVMSVSPSIFTEQLGSHWTDFDKT